jgi:single stranded DNA-binding protein
MTDINVTTLTGRLVRDPIIHHGATGGTCAQFTIASNHRYKNRDGNPQCETAFVLCKAFGAWAGSLQGRHKGDLILVAGRLKSESWEKDGTMRNQLTLICNSVHVVKLADKAESAELKTQASQIANGEAVPF